MSFTDKSQKIKKVKKGLKFYRKSIIYDIREKDKEDLKYIYIIYRSIVY